MWRMTDSMDLDYMLDKTTFSYRWLLKGSDVTSGNVMGHDHDQCAPSEEFGRQCRSSCGAAEPMRTYDLYYESAIQYTDYGAPNSQWAVVWRQSE